MRFPANHCDFRPTRKSGSFGPDLVRRRQSFEGLSASDRGTIPLWECDLYRGGRLGGGVGAAVVPALGSAAAAEGVGAGGCWFCASDSERCEDCTKDGDVSGGTAHIISCKG